MRPKIYFRRAMASLIVALAAVLSTANLGDARTSDTPESVMLAGRVASRQLEGVITDLRAAQAFAVRLDKDRAFAVRVLSLTQKQDLTGMNALLQEVAPGSTLQCAALADWKVIIVTKRAKFCMSNDGGCTNNPKGGAEITIDLR